MLIILLMLFPVLMPIISLMLFLMLMLMNCGGGAMLMGQYNSQCPELGVPAFYRTFRQNPPPHAFSASNVENSVSA